MHAEALNSDQIPFNTHDSDMGLDEDVMNKGSKSIPTIPAHNDVAVFDPSHHNSVNSMNAAKSQSIVSTDKKPNSKAVENPGDIHCAYDKFADHDQSHEQSDEQSDEQSLDSLLDEIESLTASVDKESMEIIQPTLSKKSDHLPSESRSRKYGRSICNWGQKKCKEAAKSLYRQHQALEPQHVQNLDSQTLRLKSWTIGPTGNLCYWTEYKLRKAVQSLHRERDTVEDVTGIVSADDIYEENGLKALLNWLATTIATITSFLTGEHNSKINSPQVDQPSAKAVKNTACRYFASVLREAGTSLPPGQQVAFASWILEILKSDKGYEKIDGISTTSMQHHRQFSRAHDDQAAGTSEDGDTPQSGDADAPYAQDTLNEELNVHPTEDYEANSLESAEENDTTQNLSDQSSIDTSVDSDTEESIENLSLDEDFDVCNPSGPVEVNYSNTEKPNSDTIRGLTEKGDTINQASGTGSAIKGGGGLAFWEEEARYRLADKKIFRTIFSNHNCFPCVVGAG